MIEKITRMLRLWPFHKLELGRLTIHWLAQRGALDAVYEMYMNYWREYVEPLKCIDPILVEYSRPSRIDILMGLVYGGLVWQGRERVIPPPEVLEVYKRFRAEIEEIEKVHGGMPEWWKEEEPVIK